MYKVQWKKNVNVCISLLAIVIIHFISWLLLKRILPCKGDLSSGLLQAGLAIPLQQPSARSFAQKMIKNFKMETVVEH